MFVYLQPDRSSFKKNLTEITAFEEDHSFGGMDDDSPERFGTADVDSSSDKTKVPVTGVKSVNAVTVGRTLIKPIRKLNTSDFAAAQDADDHWDKEDAELNGSPEEEEEEEPVRPVDVQSSLRRSSRAAVTLKASTGPETEKKKKQSFGTFKSSKNLSEALDDEHRNLLEACAFAEEQLFNARRFIFERQQQSAMDDYVNEVEGNFYIALLEEAVRVAHEREWECFRNAPYWRLGRDDRARRKAADSTCSCGVSHSGAGHGDRCVVCAPANKGRVLVVTGNTVARERGENEPWSLVEEVAAWISAATKEESPNPFADKFSVPLNPPGKSSKPTTLSDFVKVVQDIGSIHNIPKVGMLSFWKALHEHTDLNTPFRVNPKTGNLISTIRDYEKEDIRDNTVDACINECILYVSDLATDIFCPKCNTPRYNKCNFGGVCKYGEECSPFVNPSHKYRAAHQVMIYRSLVAKLIQMCQADVLSGGSLFNYDDFRHKEPGVLNDILDGSAVRGHMTDMHSNFLAKEQELNNPEKLRVIEVSLVLSCFYDGDKLYKRANDSVWPLLAEVLNCNPSYRTKLGLGLFLVAMHNMAIGSGAEQSMIDNLFTEEFKQGENGIEFECTDQNGERVIVFLQFRGVIFNADTKAYEKIFHVQGVGSLQGCSLCGKCHGLSRDILKSRVYCSGCLHLPDDHILRFIGEDVMPEGYYGEEAGRNAELGKEISAGAREIVIKKTPDRDDEIWHRTSLTHPRVNRGKKYVRPPNTSWHSRTSKFEHFAEAVWAAYNDNRSWEPHSRVAHEDYLENSKLAALKQARVFVEKKGKVPKTTVFAMNGVHKQLSGFSVLKSFQLPDQAPDLMHCVANVVTYWFNVMTGERGLENPSRQLSVYQKRMPYLQFENITPPFIVSNKSQLFADSVFSCINVPSKYKRDYALDLPFKHIGHLNSHQKMVLVLSYIEYFLSFTDLSLPYKRYYARWAGDLRQICTPRVRLEDLPYLQQHVIETKALSEFMFPDSEAPFIAHQIVDIVHNLQKLGPVSDWMCFTGERTMKKLGDGVPDGGDKYILPVSARFVAKEAAHNYNQAAFEENCAMYTDNAGLYTTMVLKLQKKYTTVSLSPFMRDSLFQSIQEFLLTQEITFLVLKSPFARLYYTFEDMYGNWRRSTRADKPESFPLTMSDWVQQLYALRVNDGTPFNAAKVSHLINNVVFTTFVDGVEVRGLTLRGDETDDVLTALSATVMRDFVSAGALFESDFNGIIRDLALFAMENKQPIAAFKHAVMKGIGLTGRGPEFAEPSVVSLDLSGTNAVGLRTTYLIQNKANKLTESWSPTFQLNSWCKVVDYHILGRGARREIDSKVYFGQLNYFFRLYFPSDKMLHGAAFASIVLRKAVKNKDTRHFVVSTDDTVSYHADKQFVPVHYIESTAVAVNALDDELMPMLNPKKALKAAQNAVVDYPLKYSLKNASRVVRLDMIELHKERAHLSYDSIEFDKENAKIFEEAVVLHHSQNM